MMTVKAMAATRSGLERFFRLCDVSTYPCRIYGVVGVVYWCLMAVFAFIGLFDIVVFLFVRRR
jgi:uncharacterized membrane protein